VIRNKQRSCIADNASNALAEFSVGTDENIAVLDDAS
jgi:hypothetical protein